MLIQYLFELYSSACFAVYAHATLEHLQREPDTLLGSSYLAYPAYLPHRTEKHSDKDNNCNRKILIYTESNMIRV